MSAQAWVIVGIIGFALAALLILIAVLLFVRWKIPAVLGELTGRTEKKQIKKMLQDKADAANKVNFRAQPYDRETDAQPQEQAGQVKRQGTEVTDVLGGQGADMGTTPLSEATDVLELEDVDATTILSEADMPEQRPEAAAPVPFHIGKSVMVIHTSEVIE